MRWLRAFAAAHELSAADVTAGMVMAGVGAMAGGAAVAAWWLR